MLFMVLMVGLAKERMKGMNKDKYNSEGYANPGQYKVVVGCGWYRFMVSVRKPYKMRWYRLVAVKMNFFINLS